MVNTKYRIALTRLRVSSHRLEIEMGRWHKPNKIIRSERKCQNCNVLEDEFHFILECPVYLEIRSQLLSKYYLKRPNMHKFTELLMSDNKKIVNNLAKFTYYSFIKRENTYYDR